MRVARYAFHSAAPLGRGFCADESSSTHLHYCRRGTNFSQVVIVGATDPVTTAKSLDGENELLLYGNARCAGRTTPQTLCGTSVLVGWRPKQILSSRSHEVR
jgi:hypothetical protein